MNDLEGIINEWDLLYYGNTGMTSNNKKRLVQSIQKYIDAGYVKKSDRLVERTAQCIAHRACCGSEHNPQEGKLHGYCVVCGVPFPCEYVGEKPISQNITSLIRGKE